MKTSEARRKAERERKAKRKAENLPMVRRLKQKKYFKRRRKWLPPHLLHWHHRDPSSKYRKVCHLMTRSKETINKELKKCTVLDQWEHRKLHGHSVLRTK